jgi:hypothetical protein
VGHLVFDICCDEGTRAILDLSYTDWSMGSQSCEKDVVKFVEFGIDIGIRKDGDSSCDLDSRWAVNFSPS